MKIVEPFVKLVNMEEPYKKIEYAGKICYKSQENITDDSYIRFVNNIISRGHYSVLEHEYFTVELPWLLFENVKDEFYKNGFFEVSYSNFTNNIYITGNIRAWKEFFEDYRSRITLNISGTMLEVYDLLGINYGIIFPKVNENRFVVDYINKVDFNKYSEEQIVDSYFPFEEAKKHISYTFHIRCDRATSHQIVRHRMSSFSQESQRYCNYSIDKFDNNIKFIIPVDALALDDEMEGIEELKNSFELSEKAYFSLIEKGVKPETARCVLPNATATEIVMTSNLKQWDRFIALRSDKHAQIDIREISNVIRDTIGG